MPGWLFLRERRKILELVHEKCGHAGIKRVMAIVNRHFTWPGLGADIVHHVKSCLTCARSNKAGNKLVKLQERPAEPFKVVAIDIVGPLDQGKGGTQYVLTYCCKVTKWPKAVAMSGVTSAEVAEAFIAIVCRTGRVA